MSEQVPPTLSALVAVHQEARMLREIAAGEAAPIEFDYSPDRGLTPVVACKR